MLKRMQVVARAWGHYECASLAAGVAFYAALSIFPLMMVLVAGVGYFFRFMPDGPSARDEILEILSRQMSVEFADSMSKLLLQVQDRALVNGPLAGVAFLFTASLVFAQIDRGFYRIWDVRRRGDEKGIKGALRKAVSSRARSFAMIVAVCFIVIVLFLMGLAVRTLGELSTVKLIIIPQVSKYLSLPLGVVINVVVLTLLYQYLSKARVSWKLSFVSAVIAAGLWELGSPVMSMLSFGANLSVYGLIGSFLVVLVWIYFTVMILFIGALIVRVEKKIARLNRSA
ncbi:YihY/virulence factor BrkB family protein [Verrucomicrobiaceae bacterium 227]